MSKKNRNFRRKNDKKKEQSNLSIKVGDWFETKTDNVVGNNLCLYCVKSINETHIVFTTIYTNPSNGSIEISLQEWSKDGFKRSGNNIVYTNLGISKFFTRISEEGAYYTVNSFSWQVGCILNCFRVKPTPQPSSEETKENNSSKNCGQLWKRFKDLEGKYIKLFYSGGYGIQYLKVREVDYDSEDNKFRISGFGPYLRRGIIHNGWDWSNYVCEKERVLQEDLLQAEEISKEEFKKAEEMLREKLSHEKTVRNFLEKDKKPLTDLVGKYLKFTRDWATFGTMYFHLKDIQIETYGDYQCCKIQYENDRFSVNKKGGIIYLAGTDKDSISFEEFKDAVIITEEEFNMALNKSKEKYPESKSSSHEKTVKEFLEIDKNSLVDLKGKHLKYTKEDWDGTTEYFQIKNLGRKVRSSYPGDGYCNIQYGTRFLVDRSGKITNKTSDEHESFPFESFKDAVIISEEEFNKARFREGVKKQEKSIKIYTKEELKSSILKYTSPDGSIYYLEHPEIPKVGIENKPGKFKYCIVSYGIIISNGGQVHYYTPKTNTFNPIVLLIESESDEGFFSRVEEIPDYEWASLKEFYQDEIVKI